MTPNKTLDQEAPSLGAFRLSRVLAIEDPTSSKLVSNPRVVSPIKKIPRVAITAKLIVFYIKYLVSIVCLYICPCGLHVIYSTDLIKIGK